MNSTVDVKAQTHKEEINTEVDYWDVNAAKHLEVKMHVTVKW